MDETCLDQEAAHKSLEVKAGYRLEIFGLAKTITTPVKNNAGVKNNIKHWVKRKRKRVPTALPKSGGGNPCCQLPPLLG